MSRRVLREIRESLALPSPSPDPWYFPDPDMCPPWTVEARSVACPQCGAPPGAYCQSSAGRTMRDSTYHRARNRLTNRVRP